MPILLIAQLRVPIKFHFKEDSIIYQNGEWRALDSLTTGKTIYFLGETHNMRSNELMHLNYFKYLYYRQGVRNYIMEGNPSLIYLVNSYVQTGIKHYLELLNALVPKTDSVSEKTLIETNLLIQGLYEFNQVLAKEKRIQVRAIDAESFYYTHVMMENLAKKYTSIPPECRKLVDVLLKFKSSELAIFIKAKDRIKIKKLQEEMRAEIDNHRELFENTFKEDMFWIDMVINNKASLKRNELNLQKNFQLALNRLGNNSKYYFQYGRLHAQLKKPSLAYLLNTSENFKGKVLAAGTQYSNCTFLFGSSQLGATFGCISAMGKKKELLFYNNLKIQPQNDVGLIFFTNNFKNEYFDFAFDIRNQ